MSLRPLGPDSVTSKSPEPEPDQYRIALFTPVDVTGRVKLADELDTLSLAQLKLLDVEFPLMLLVLPNIVKSYRPL